MAHGFHLTDSLNNGKSPAHTRRRATIQDAALKPRTAAVRHACAWLLWFIVQRRSRPSFPLGRLAELTPKDGAVPTGSRRRAGSWQGARAVDLRAVLCHKLQKSAHLGRQVPRRRVDDLQHPRRRADIGSHADQAPPRRGRSETGRTGTVRASWIGGQWPQRSVLVSPSEHGSVC